MLIDGLLQMSRRLRYIWGLCTDKLWKIGMKRWRHLSNSASGEICNGGLLFSTWNLRNEQSDSRTAVWNQASTHRAIFCSVRCFFCQCRNPQGTRTIHGYFSTVVTPRRFWKSKKGTCCCEPSKPKQCRKIEAILLHRQKRQRSRVKPKLKSGHWGSPRSLSWYTRVYKLAMLTRKFQSFSSCSFAFEDVVAYLIITNHPSLGGCIQWCS